MAEATFDPKTDRSIQTRDGVVTIPRTQKGIPLSEYFNNAEFPQDIERSIVHVTRSGPVLTPPDPIPWNEQHNEKAKHYAGKVKELIEEKGYYSKTLNLYAKNLAEETGHPKDETKAIIVKAFENEHGKDPFKYLQEVRAEQGLPVRDRQLSQGQSQSQAPAQDMG